MTTGNDALLDHLLTRRSVAALRLLEPAPSTDELQKMLTAAVRVPDHGKLAPWRFVIFEGEARKKWAERLVDIWRERNESASAEAEAAERTKLGGAPLVVAVVSTAAEHPKIPVWEQELSAGAVCLNLVHAAHAMGYAGQWLTGWPAYDDAPARLLKLSENERVAGFIHIGTPSERPADRDRPDVAALTTRFES